MRERNRGVHVLSALAAAASSSDVLLLSAPLSHPITGQLECIKYVHALGPYIEPAGYCIEESVKTGHFQEPCASTCLNSVVGNFECFQYLMGLCKSEEGFSTKRRAISTAYGQGDSFILSVPSSDTPPTRTGKLKILQYLFAQGVQFDNIFKPNRFYSEFSLSDSGLKYSQRLR